MGRNTRTAAKEAQERQTSDYFDGVGTLAAMADVPILDKDAQMALLKAAQAGDNEAKMSLALSNIKIAFSMASRYYGLAKQRTYLDFDDLVMAGFEGLLNACDLFNEERSNGAGFVTYAVPWVRQRISRSIEDSTLAAKIPNHAVQDVFALFREASAIEQETGVQTPVEDIVAMLAKDGRSKMKKNNIIAALNIMSAVSLYTPVAGTNGDEDSVLADFVAISSQSVEDEAITNVTIRAIDEALGSFSERDADIVRRRFGIRDGRVETLQEIADDYGMSRERVRQIESRCLRALRYKKELRKLSTIA